MKHDGGDGTCLRRPTLQLPIRTAWCCTNSSFTHRLSPPLQTSWDTFLELVSNPALISILLSLIPYPLDFAVRSRISLSSFFQLHRSKYALLQQARCALGDCSLLHQRARSSRPSQAGGASRYVTSTTPFMTPKSDLLPI